MVREAIIESLRESPKTLDQLAEDTQMTKPVLRSTLDAMTTKAPSPKNPQHTVVDRAATIYVTVAGVWHLADPVATPKSNGAKS